MGPALHIRIFLPYWKGNANSFGYSGVQALLLGKGITKVKW